VGNRNRTRTELNCPCDECFASAEARETTRQLSQRNYAPHFRDLIRGGLNKESVRARLRPIPLAEVERRTLHRSVGIHSARNPEGLGAAKPPPQAGLLVADRLGAPRAAQGDPLRLTTHNKKHFTAVVREQVE
jgi:hypothetical protein